MLQHFDTNSLTFPAEDSSTFSTDVRGGNLDLELQRSQSVHPIAHRRTGTQARIILVSDAQKHVFKAPVYNVHLHIITVF